jgi:hypothetical protein
MPVKFKMDVVPANNSTAPTGIFRIQRSYNNGAYSDIFSVTNPPASSDATLSLNGSRVFGSGGGLAQFYGLSGGMSFYDQAGSVVFTSMSNTGAWTYTPTSLTAALATSILSATQTWNTSGTPTAIKLNITDTASNAASLLMDLQTGGTSRFKVDKTGGIISAANGLALAGTTFQSGKITYGGASSFQFLQSTGITGANTATLLDLSTISISPTSGITGLVGVSGTFAPTSGTSVMNSFTINPTINQTGGANGITRSLYINPTLTSAADYRAIEISSGVAVLAASTTASASLRVPSGTSPTSPINGDIWNDSTQKAPIAFSAGARQTLQGVIFTQTATGTIANSVTETAISSTGVGTLTLPANFFVAGKTLKITGLGIHSSAANPTIRIKIKFGSTIMLDTTAVGTKNSTDEGFQVTGVITCRTTGVSGTVFSQGFYNEGASGTGNFDMKNTAATTIDTTASQAMTITAEWGTASASNTISLTNLVVEVLN